MIPYFGLPTTTLDRFFDRSKRSTESSRRIEAGGMDFQEDQAEVPETVGRQGVLDKPITEQIQAYCRVSHSSIQKLIRIEKDRPGNSESSKSTHCKR